MASAVDARHLRDVVQFLARWRFRDRVIVGEGAEQPAVGRLDGHGPAGPQVVLPGDIAERCPNRVRLDIFHNDRFAAKRCRPARPHERPEFEAVHYAVVIIRQTRRGTVNQALPCGIDEQHGGAQRLFGAIFHSMNHVLQHLAQRHARNDAPEHGPLEFELA